MSKYCVDCKHSYTGIQGITWCKHPALGIDPVSGKQRSSLASMERFNFQGRCGEIGNHFEQKEKAKGLIAWLTNVFS